MIIRSVIFYLLLISMSYSFGVLVTSHDQLSQMRKDRRKKINEFHDKLGALSVEEMVRYAVPSMVVSGIHLCAQGPEPSALALWQFFTSIGAAIIPSLVLFKAMTSISFGQRFSVWEQLENAIDPEEFIFSSKKEIDDLCGLVIKPKEDKPFYFQDTFDKAAMTWEAYEKNKFSNNKYSQWYKKKFDALPVGISKKENKILPKEMRALILEHLGIKAPTTSNENYLLQGKALVKALPFTGWGHFATLQKKHGDTPLMQWMSDYRRLYVLCEADALNFESGQDYTKYSYYPHCVKKDDSKVAQMYGTKHGPPFYLNVNNQELIEFHRHYDWKKHNELVMCASGLNVIISDKKKND